MLVFEEMSEWLCTEMRLQMSDSMNGNWRIDLDQLGWRGCKNGKEQKP